MSILRLFAALIPVIVFSTNVATLTILVAGGRFVINGSMTLGDFTAVQQLSRDSRFPGHRHRIHEQCHGAGHGFVSAHFRNSGSAGQKRYR